MKYDGQELTPITTPQIFDPPRRMLVWDSGSHKPRIELVWGIAPASAKSEFPIHCVGNVHYEICAEIPQTKPKRATGIQLAEWLAKGNGMWKGEGAEYVSDSISPHQDVLEKEVGDDILILPFGTTDWLEPTLENMGMEE